MLHCKTQPLLLKRAIKRLHPFVRPEIIRDEALKLKEVSSPYVMQIFDFFEEEGALVMEYCPLGLDKYVRDRLRQTEGRIPYDEARDFLHGVLQGLNDAHKAGIVHGDVKPTNIRFGEDGLPKLGDFGAATRIFEDTKLLRGSTSWMAPEVLSGGDATEHADYFSYGLIAYLVLAGRHPYYANDPTCLMREDENISSTTYQPVHLATLRADIPPPVADLLMELLSRDPSRRERAEEALKAALSQPIEEAVPLYVDRRPTAIVMTEEDQSILKATYDTARYTFFAKYRADDAADEIASFLADFDWRRFEGSEIDELADSWSFLAYIRNSQGRFSDAVAAATNGLLISSEHVGSLHTRGYAYIQLHQYENALSDLRKAVDSAVRPRKRDQISSLLETTKQRLRAISTQNP